MPLLKHAVETAADDELKQRAAFTLFETHLDLKNWRAAESMFALAEKRLSPSEDPEWLGRIALIAAQAGDKQDAMRLFRRVANCNLRCRRLVDDMADLGLEAELREFYHDAQRRLPTAKLDGIVE